MSPSISAHEDMSTSTSLFTSSPSYLPSYVAIALRSYLSIYAIKCRLARKHLQNVNMLLFRNHTASCDFIFFFSPPPVICVKCFGFIALDKLSSLPSEVNPRHEGRDHNRSLLHNTKKPKFTAVCLTQSGVFAQFLSVLIHHRQHVSWLSSPASSSWW